jgi:hypothetical protein
MDFLRQQGLLVDVGKHQLIMTASMKVIRVVASSGGPGGLYTAVASSSTEYGCLFAEYQDVAQHKEESGKHQFIMMASMKVIREVAPSGSPGGLYTAVASSSTEYRPLFAEYQDVAQHKEELGIGQASDHHDGLHDEGHQSCDPIWRPHHGVGGCRPQGRGLINPACSFLRRQQTEGDPCNGREEILQANCT